MNLARILRATTVLVSLLIGFVSPSYAQVSAYFSPGASCTQGNNNVSFVPGGAPVTASLCMNSSAPAALTCGYTAVLEAAAVGENGRFTVTAVSRTGSPFQDLNSDVAQLPLSIVTAPVTVADLGATVTAVGNTITPATGAANVLLATFTITPSASATNNTYVISLNSASAAAVDADGQCGVTTIPTDAPLTATLNLNRSAGPAFTSANATTFSTASSNTFTVAAAGIPTPTLSLTSGTLPSGVSFTAGTGVLSGTPAGPNATYPLTFTATNGTGSVQQSFTLTVSGTASQTITFANPGTQSFGSTPVALTASASSGLPVTFTSNTLNVCSVSGSNVTMLTLGLCTITASQAGGGSFAAAASVSQSFGITGTVPGAPTIGVATPGDGQATIAFTPPTSTGGVAITSYTVTCGSVSKSGTASPITVSPLTNGTPYNCSVSATNSLGTGPSSATVSVTPAAGALSLISVVSRKTHGVAGTFDVPINFATALAGSVSVEPRTALGAPAAHTIVFQFSGQVTATGTPDARDAANAVVGSVSATFSGSEVTVTISGVPDNKRLTVSLAGVNGTALNVSASLGFLVGDVNGSRTVTSADILQVKGRSGLSTDPSNFLYDLNASGSITSADILQVKGRSGLAIP